MKAVMLVIPKKEGTGTRDTDWIWSLGSGRQIYSCRKKWGLIMSKNITVISDGESGSRRKSFSFGGTKGRWLDFGLV